MADLPYSFVPETGYNAYKVTSLLKDYLALQMEEPGNPELINSILHLIDDYIIQLKKLRAQYNTTPTKQVYDAIDGFFINSPETGKEEITCKTGCTACCFIDLDVSLDEAALIIDYCKKIGIDIDRTYLTEQAAAGRKSYSDLSRCIFLKENLCSIYPVRPVACRKHWVKTDPALCDFSKNIANPVGAFFNVNSEILASAMLNVSEVMPFEKALLHVMDLNPVSP